MKSILQSKAFLDQTFGNAAKTSRTTLRMSLFTTNPAGISDSFIELAVGSYVRRAFSNNTTTFPAATGGGPAIKVLKSAAVTAGAAVPFVRADVDMGPITGFGIHDTSGPLLWWNALPAPVMLYANSVFSFTTGALTIRDAGSAKLSEGCKSIFLQKKQLDELFSNTTKTSRASLFFALFITRPTTATDTGVEMSGNGYTRATVANNVTNFPAATQTGTDPTQKTHAIDITFPAATGAPWAGLTGVGVYDAVSAGNLLYWWPAATFSVAVGAVKKFTAGTLLITEQ